MSTFNLKINPETIAIAEEYYKIPKPYNKLPGCKNSASNVEKYKQINEPKPCDANKVKDVLSHSNRFKNLKPAAIKKIQGQLANYEYMKKIAVARLEETVENQLKIFSQIVVNKEKQEGREEVIKHNGLTHDIFSWGWKEFLARRKLKSFVWIDILLRMSENHLRSFKYQTDLKELQLFLNKIFLGFFSTFDNENIDTKPHIANTIDEAKTALYTLEYLEKEFNKNSKEYQHLFFKDFLQIDAKRNSEERMLKSFLENRLCNSHILDPIEVRYQINWYKNIVQQNQYLIETSVKKYKGDISRYRDQADMEGLINGNCLDFCYSSIEDYKSRIAKLQYTYDKELDEMDTKLSFMVLKIEKLKDQRNWLSSEIERFHCEEEEMRLKIEKDV